MESWLVEYKRLIESDNLDAARNCVAKILILARHTYINFIRLDKTGWIRYKKTKFECRAQNR